jgi:lysophospholipase L1-like esterase
MPMTGPLLIAGDSLAEGVGAPDQHGWAQRVNDYFPGRGDILRIGDLPVRELTDVLASH